MTFEIDLDGKAHAVSVERLRASEPRFRITIDGVSHIVDAQQAEAGGWSLVLVESGRSYDTAVARGAGAGELVVTTRGHAVPVIVNGRRVRRSGEATAAAGAQPVMAPMPGKVLRVLVKAGDEVALRQPLVVVEAMKMENELTSPKAGRVRDVNVEAGASVEAGRSLIVIE
jgi:biotin carboxyl carrier protein